MVGIYMIKNNDNKKVYIGKSINIMTRWNEHMKQGENATEFDDTFHFELNQHPEYFSFNTNGLTISPPPLNLNSQEKNGSGCSVFIGTVKLKCSSSSL